MTHGCVELRHFYPGLKKPGSFGTGIQELKGALAAVFSAAGNTATHGATHHLAQLMKGALGMRKERLYMWFFYQ